MTSILRTRVAIVGAGPAGLVLSQLLSDAGIESIIVDSRGRASIESTIRDGILEQGTVDLLRSLDPNTRVDTVGHRHDGIGLGFAGEGHRIDFPSLVGRSVWLYPQHEVLKDLLALRLGGGQDLRFGVTVEHIDDTDPTHPRVIAVDADGVPLEIEADFVVGADGSRSVVRPVVTESSSGGYFREYPFAWFGILCEEPPSADELIYSNSDAGFALISQRSPTVQRMYFQCDPESDASAPSDAEIWDTFQARVPGTKLQEGPVIQRDVLRFRSFVAHELRRGRIALVGDAAHTVPPTGAKGMNRRRGAARRSPPGIAHQGRRAAHRRLPRACADSNLEGSALLMMDDEHAAHGARGERIRPATPARRAPHDRRFGSGPTYLAEAYTGCPPEWTRTDSGRPGRRTRPWVTDVSDLRLSPGPCRSLSPCGVARARTRRTYARRW